MAQQDEELPEGEVALLIALWAVEEAVNRLASAQRRLSHVLTRRRRATTVSCVSGMPCGAFDFQREAAPDVSHEALTHEVAPPPDGFASRDEPPSRPA